MKGMSVPCYNNKNMALRTDVAKKNLDRLFTKPSRLFWTAHLQSIFISLKYLCSVEISADYKISFRQWNLPVPGS